MRGARAVFNLGVHAAAHESRERVVGDDLRGGRFPRLVRGVIGWLADLGRMAWALFYWNTRKAVYRRRRGRGQCPCQNPSDSGEPMRTGCEAAIHWREPGRFRRVCPLLQQNEAGRWVCSVRAAEVRPFWGRAWGYAGGTMLAVGLAAALTVFGLMRWIGYDVSPRQIVWPPAWSELHDVRAQLFIQQARRYYAKGEVREALTALSVAYGLNPQNYRVAMMLAQFYQLESPSVADDLYATLLRDHPEHRVETARVWFRSLLARGRLRDVAEVARRRLEVEPGQTAAWTHALIFSARHLQRPDILEIAAAEEGIPLSARTLLWLAAKVQLSPAGEARAVLLTAPLIDDFPYDLVYRSETLTALGFPEDALELVKQSGGKLAGRDVARLTLAAYAKAGDTESLEREFGALLAVKRPLRADELTLLAIHLVRYPNASLLARVADGLTRVPKEPWKPRLEACLAVFCAAGVQQDGPRMDGVKRQIKDTIAIKEGSLTALQNFFLRERNKPQLGPLLAQQQNAMTLELNYALLDRYLPIESARAKSTRSKRR